MLDKKSQKVLDIISMHSNGEYKVLEINDILTKLPTKYKMNNDEIGNIFSYLKDMAYIDIKYIDNSEICYAILPKFRIYEENLLEQKKLNRKLVLIVILSGVVSGICSFLGSFVSQIIG